MSIPPQPGSVKGTHAVLREQLQLSAILTDPVKNAGAAFPAEPKTVLEREGQLRCACQDAIGDGRFREVLTRCLSDEGALADFLNRATSLLGLRDAELLPEEDTDDVLLTLASTLSVQMLRLPFAVRIRALAIGEIVLRRVFLLNPSALCPQSAHHLLVKMGPALALVALDDVAMFEREAAGTGSFPVPDSADSELMLAASLAARFTREGKGTLDALEMAIPAGMAVVDRSALLVQLGELVERNERELREKDSQKG